MCTVLNGQKQVMYSSSDIYDNKIITPPPLHPFIFKENFNTNKYKYKCMNIENKT